MPDLPDRLAAALADRYTIERELGRGGNAVVYLAHDPKHDRPVALKVLLPELAASVRSERFLREIQIAARLSHPHILALYDSGEANGVLYYVMPFVEGESLRDRLNREHQLPLEDALAITRDVAAALGYAHAQGVIHRDIKPENVMLAHGKPLVMDFGIARALTVAGGQTVTQSGIAVGTPAYMSPEQAGGSGEVDGRSDIYSLGCVLYEMLTGHPPFAGATAQEILARHTLDPVPGLSAARSDVPEALERVITKALAKQPVGRYPTATEFATALTATPAGRPNALTPRRRLLYAGLGLGVLLGGYAVAVRTNILRPAVPAASAQSVAVLPFVNVGGDTAYEYFSDGMTEELIGALVQVEGLRVPARTSSFRFKASGLDLPAIGRQLNVSHVVEGSVRRSGNRLRVTAQLIKVADGYHVWSETYERDLRDVFAVQHEVSRAIVSALQVKLATGESVQLVRHHTTEDLEAYDLYLKGRYYWNRRSDENSKQAIAYFAAAIARDSTYALAYSGLADAYIWAGIDLALSRGDAFRKAKAAALKAVALDPTSAEAHTSLGRARYSVDWDWVGTEGELQRAISLNPKYAVAHSWYGYFLANVKVRYNDAIREAVLAWQLDSLAPNIAQNLGLIYLRAGRDQDAARALQKAIELDPAQARAHRYLGDTYFHQGRYDAALAAYTTALGLRPSPIYMASMGAVLVRTGRRDSALAILDQLHQRAPRVPMAEALLESQLGLLDRAAISFEAATQSPLTAVPVQFHDLLLDPIRSHPRYIARLKELGVEP